MTNDQIGELFMCLWTWAGIALLVAIVIEALVRSNRDG